MVFKEIDFANFDGTMIVPECQNANIIHKCQYSNSYFSKPTGLITLERVAIKFMVPRSTNWWKKCHFPSCIHILPTRNARVFWKMGSIWWLNSCFSKPTGLISSFKIPNIKRSTCVGIFRWILLISLLAVESWLTRNARKCQKKVLTRQFVRTHNPSAQLASWFVFASSFQLIPFYLRKTVRF